MQAVFGKTGLVIAVALLLSACSSGDPHLMALSTGDGPDEFQIVPGKPLETPKNYNDLPLPTPGGKNITDATPFEDAVSALGGNPSALALNGVPSSDGGLVGHATRYGVQPDVRNVLAAEDLEHRRSHRGKLLYRISGQDRYFKAYDDLSLDQYQELRRLLAAGVKTPSAPPEPGR